MHLVKVKCVPQNHSNRLSEVEKLLTEFLDSGMLRAKVALDPDETVPPINAFRYFTRGVNAYPVCVYERDDGIYLARRNP